MKSLSEKCLNQIGLPVQIRVSLGTAIVLGLIEGKLDAPPTTAYLMTYKDGKCSANCGFCPQARGSKSNTELLSRVSWPTFATSTVLSALAKAAMQVKIGRVCIQALNYPEVFSHLEAFVEQLKKHTNVAVSVSCQPLNRQNIERLAKAGVNRLGIALDAATKDLFDKVKGKDAGGAYSWESQFGLLNEALSVFGKGNVSTHVIVGLGETERQAVEIIQKCVDMEVLPALFTFTPIRGTTFEAKKPPSVDSYRRVQLARYLIVRGLAKSGAMRFSEEGEIVGFGLAKDAIEPIVESGMPFRTSGCADCNRPFYNEKPSGPIYNYPRSLKQEEIEEIKKTLLG